MKILLFTLILIVVFPIVILSNVWAETPTEKAIREATEQGELVSNDVKEDLEKELKLSKQGSVNEKILLIYSNTSWSGSILDTSDVRREFEGEGNRKIPFTCVLDDYYSMSFQTKADGYMALLVIHQGRINDFTVGTLKFFPEEMRGSCGTKSNDSMEYPVDTIKSFFFHNAKPIFSIEWVKKDIEDQKIEESNNIKNHAVLLVYTYDRWHGTIQDSGLDSSSVDGVGLATIPFECTAGGTYSLSIQHIEEKYNGLSFIPTLKPLRLLLAVIQDGKLLDSQFTYTKNGVVSLVGKCQPSTIALAVKKTSTDAQGGGCLIATAAFGSEMAPQVQMLRELRDNSLLQTNSGRSFMVGFNQFYYSFSPTVADWERQNPVFKEIVKATITPLITTLSILNYLNINSEAEMLGYGIGVIALNIGMYFIAPAFVIMKIKKSR